MARFKQVRNSSQLYTQNANGSGKSFLNEKIRLNLLDSRQTRQPYIPIGTNTDHLIIETAYNDNNTINFNVDDNYNGPSEQQLWATNIATGLSEELLGRDQPEWIPKNERITINEQLATPSTLSDMSLIFDKNNRKNLVDKFTKKGNPIEVKFHPFNDVEYIHNNLTNQDFIKGDGEYSFLNTNLYEETSIDIELDTPIDTILQNTAQFQEHEILGGDTQLDYIFTEWLNSPYSFRQNASTQPQTRLNTPFVIYNFEKKCWEYRGVPNPSIYYQNLPANNRLNLSFKHPIYNGCPVNFDQSTNTFPLLRSIRTTDFDNDVYKFLTYYNEYCVSELPLTNNPINYLYIQNTNGKNNMSNISLPTSLFGFPHFPKFYPFDDNILKMSKYINKPFIIDRISLNLNVELMSQSFKNSNEFCRIDASQYLTSSLNFFITKRNRYSNNKGFKLSFVNKLAITPFKTVKNIDPALSLINEFSENNLTSFMNKKFWNISKITTFNKINNQIVANSLNTLTTNPTITNTGNDDRPVNRIMMKQELNYNDLINLTTFDDDSSNSLTIKSNIAGDSYENEIITFGNIVFYSDGDLNLSYKFANQTKLNKIKKNCDLLINTTENDTYDNKGNKINYNNYPEDYLLLDFQGNVNVNTYIKKVSAVKNFLIKDETYGLSSHLLNDQIEIPDSIDNIFTTSFGTRYKEEEKLNWTRNGLNSLTGRDVQNGYSHFKTDTDIVKIESNDFNFTRYNPRPGYQGSPNRIIVAANTTSNITPFPQKKLPVSGNISLNKLTSFSPYILLPNDELSFSLSTSPTLSTIIYKELFKLKKGKIKFTLHGYIPKNNKSIEDYKNLKNLNQNNLSSTILGDTQLITNDYSYAYAKNQRVLNFYDRIYTNKFTEITSILSAYNDYNTSVDPPNVPAQVDISQDIIDGLNATPDKTEYSILINCNVNRNNEALGQQIQYFIITLNKLLTSKPFQEKILDAKAGLNIKIKNIGYDDNNKLGSLLIVERMNTTDAIDFFSGNEWINLVNGQVRGHDFASIENKTYKFRFNLNTKRFERIVEDRQLKSESLGQIIPDIGSILLTTNNYINFINLKINAYKVDSKYINDFKYSYDDSFSFKDILQQVYSIWNNIRSYIEGLQGDEGELTSNQKTLTLFLKINTAKLNRLIQEMTYFKNSTRTNNIAAKNKRNHSKYFELRSYGQFKDRVNQNISMMMINNENAIESTVEQRFVNGQTGVDLYNFTTGVLNDLKNVTTRNKSRYCSLLDAGYNLNSEGDVQKWSTNDYWHYKHVAFKDDVTNDSYLTTIIPSVAFNLDNVRQIIF